MHHDTSGRPNVHSGVPVQVVAQVRCAVVAEKHAIRVQHRHNLSITSTATTRPFYKRMRRRFRSGRSSP